MSRTTLLTFTFASMAFGHACGDDDSVPLLPGAGADVGVTDAQSDALLDAPADLSGDVPDASVVCDEDVRAGSFAVNIVDEAAAAELERALVFESAADLRRVTSRYYEHFADDVDFLFLFPDRQVSDGIAGNTEVVNRPAMPWLGLANAASDPEYGSDGALRSAIMMNFSDVGNGPTLHETLHWWGVFFDERFGFGRDAEQFFGAHWGLAGVAGQLGGFPADGLRCADPPGAEPPCNPAPEGGFVVTTPGFQPGANNDGEPYAPIELYLMGLVPASEVPGPFPVMPDAAFQSYDEASDRITFTTPEILSVSLDDIIAFHGEAPEAGPQERAFRAAFVMVSAERASNEVFGRLENWAAIFGGDLEVDWLHSFESATGGRATMDVSPGATREGVAPACPADG